MDSILALQTGSPSKPTQSTRDDRLWKLANDLEASFLSEMLKTTGVGKTPDSFGGGAGEEHFSSFFVQELADAMTDAGGLGLSEAIYRSLIADQGERS